MNLKQMKAINDLYLTDKHPWPRGALRLKPTIDRRLDKPIEDMRDLEKFGKLNKDVYLNIFSDDQIRSKEYDKIFIDIDDPIPDYARMKLLSVGNALNEKGLKYTVLRSGGKGYHIYIFFKSVWISNYRECCLKMMSVLGLTDLVDLAVFEPKRVSRIPYSYHSDGKQCIPLGNDVFEIDQEAKLVVEVNPNFHSIFKTFDTPDRRYTMGKIIEGRESELFSDNQYYPECMSMLVADAEEGVDLGHVERVELGKFLLHVYGGDVDKVAKHYTQMSDYRERKTKYQLEHLKKGQYKMMNCKSMLTNGLCPIEEQSECPFSPTLNAFLKHERENKT